MRKQDVGKEAKRAVYDGVVHVFSAMRRFVADLEEALPEFSTFMDEYRRGMMQGKGDSYYLMLYLICVIVQAFPDCEMDRAFYQSFEAHLGRLVMSRQLSQYEYFGIIRAKLPERRTCETLVDPLSPVVSPYSVHSTVVAHLIVASKSIPAGGAPLGSELAGTMEEIPMACARFMGDKFTEVACLLICIDAATGILCPSTTRCLYAYLDALSKGPTPGRVPEDFVVRPR